MSTLQIPPFTFSIHQILPSPFSEGVKGPLSVCPRLTDLPLTCARSIPFSAASFLASGLMNTRPFRGPEGGAAAAATAGLGVGAAAAGALNTKHAAIEVSH